MGEFWPRGGAREDARGRRSEERRRRARGGTELTSTVHRRGALERVNDRRIGIVPGQRGSLISSQFRTLWGRKRMLPGMEIGSCSREFGPDSGMSFHAIPNTGIRVQILEFLIPDPIQYIQTRCNRFVFSFV
jgi:hypothetical protein